MVTLTFCSPPSLLMELGALVQLAILLLTVSPYHHPSIHPPPPPSLQRSVNKSLAVGKHGLVRRATISAHFTIECGRTLNKRIGIIIIISNHRASIWVRVAQYSHPSELPVLQSHKRVHATIIIIVHQSVPRRRWRRRVGKTCSISSSVT